MSQKINIIDEIKFNSCTSRRYRNENLEFFKCPGCKSIFLGLPDSHECLIDANDPSKKAPYSLPKGTKCFQCGELWHDGKVRWLTEDIKPDELKKSTWKWLLKN